MPSQGDACSCRRVDEVAVCRVSREGSRRHHLSSKVATQDCSSPCQPTQSSVFCLRTTPVLIGAACMSRATSVRGRLAGREGSCSNAPLTHDVLFIECTRCVLGSQSWVNDKQQQELVTQKTCLVLCQQSPLLRLLLFLALHSETHPAPEEELLPISKAARDGNLAMQC